MKNVLKAEENTGFYFEGLAAKFQNTSTFFAFSLTLFSLKLLSSICELNLFWFPK